MRTSKTISATVVVLLATLSILTMICVGHAAEQATVKIGMVTSLTGPMAPPFKDSGGCSKANGRSDKQAGWDHH